MIKKIIIFSLILCICSTNIVLANIDDIDNHWAYTQIIRGINNKWINGYPDNTFKPENNIKSNEFIKILVSIIEDNIQTNTKQWDKPYIDYAFDIGILKSKDKDFNYLIDRQKVCNLIFNFINIKLEENSELNNNEQIKKEYKDINVQDKEIIFLLNNNIINGYPDNTLRLDNYITRAEAICVITRAIDYIDKYNYSYNYTEDIFHNNNISNYTNYDGNNELFLNTYKVKNNKVIYSDSGRLDVYKNKIVEKYNDKVIQILLSLINKELYVLNTYDPNQKAIYIAIGEDKEYINNGNSLFEIILFEDKQEIEEFKFDVQINVYKLWKELNDINSNIKFNQNYQRKFMNLLKVFLSNEDLNNIIENIQNNILRSPNEKYYFKKIGQNYFIYLNLF